MDTKKTKQVFSFYLGQQVSCQNDLAIVGTLLGVAGESVIIQEENLGISIKPSSHCKLLLRGLGDITVEEVRDIARMAVDNGNLSDIEVIDVSTTEHGRYANIFDKHYELGNFLNIDNDFSVHITNLDSGEPEFVCNQCLITQYLMERGFAIPLLTLGGNTAITVGLADKTFKNKKEIVYGNV